MGTEQARDMFYASQRKHDERIVERNLTGWIQIIQQKMQITLALEKDFEGDVKEELQRLFYENMVNKNMGYEDVKIKYESLGMLYDEAVIYANEIMRINQAFFNAATLGPNQARYIATVEADWYAAKQRLDEMDAPIDFRELFKEFIDSVNEFTGESYNTVGEMIDYYEIVNDPIFNKKNLTIIKIARNVWAHPEGNDAQQLIDKGVKEIKLILTKIK